jgi:small subunit ribosomal protein S21
LLYDADGNHTHGSIADVAEAVLAEVRIYDGESLESALRRFKRQVQQEGIIKEVKRHSFLKPGEKKRLKSKLAQKLKRKKVRRQPAETDSKAAPRNTQ